MEIRKTILVKETTSTNEHGDRCDPVTQVAAIAVVKNPATDPTHGNTCSLEEIGALLGERLADELLALLGKPPICYGKAALIGTLGTAEHGAAVLHPRMGKPVREAIGGGKALMPSNAKVAGMGTEIDMPLAHIDDPWMFSHIDTMTLVVPDAPREDELMVCVGFSDGGRAGYRQEV